MCLTLIPETERNTSMSQNTTKITATVLRKTKETLEDNSRITGLSVGEVIDRFALRFKPHTPEVAAILIFEYILIALQGLESEQIPKALEGVFLLTRQILQGEKAESMQSLMDEFDGLFS